MEKKSFVIGIDGGGTKTHAIISNVNGDVIVEHIAGPSNFQIIGVETAAQTIFSLIQSCCESVNCTVKDIQVVALGLTGAGREHDQQRMTDGLQAYARSQKTTLKKILVESDARIALEGAFKGERGIILIAGTGSIAFGKDARGNVHRVGGWGRILGDEGSGFFIGRNGLNAVTRHIDGRGEKTMLTKKIAQQFGLSSQTEIIAAVYKNNFDVASVAPFVLESARKKDAVCSLIIQQASTELCEHVRALSQKLLQKNKKIIQQKIPLSFVGGLLTNDTLLSHTLSAQIRSTLPHIHIVAPMASPAYGAVVMALHQAIKKK